MEKVVNATTRKCQLFHIIDYQKFKGKKSIFLRKGFSPKDFFRIIEQNMYVSYSYNVHYTTIDQSEGAEKNMAYSIHIL